MAMIPIGNHVEIKGFGKWIGTTLLGEIVGYFQPERYIVKLWTVMDPDDSGEYQNKPKDDEYYFQKQDQYHIVRTRSVRQAVEREYGLDFNIGDVVDWDEVGIMWKGTIIQKVVHEEYKGINPDERCSYVIELDGNNRIAKDYNYRIRPHLPWP